MCDEYQIPQGYMSIDDPIRMYENLPEAKFFVHRVLRVEGCRTGLLQPMAMFYQKNLAVTFFMELVSLAEWNAYILIDGNDDVHACHDVPANLWGAHWTMYKSSELGDARTIDLQPFIDQCKEDLTPGSKECPIILDE